MTWRRQSNSKEPAGCRRYEGNDQGRKSTLQRRRQKDRRCECKSWATVLQMRVVCSMLCATTGLLRRGIGCGRGRRPIFNGGWKHFLGTRRLVSTRGNSFG